MKQRKDYWNDISRDVLGKFCVTMRKLGFDTTEFIDEDGYWNVTTYGETLPKVMPDFEISRLRSRVNFENDVFKHAQKLWQESLRRGINVNEKRFFNVSEVNALGVEYLEKYIDYDLRSWAEVLDTKKNWLARKLFKGYFATHVCFLYSDWSKTRRACVARLFRKAFASVVLAHIEVSNGITSEDIEYESGRPFGIPENTPNGAFVEYVGRKFREFRKEPLPQGPLKVQPMVAYWGEGTCVSFRYRVSDLLPRYAVIQEPDQIPWKEKYTPYSPLGVYNF